MKTDLKHFKQSMRKKPRIGETLIQGFLFACGLLSIMVTIGIVYELGKEALLFFTHQQWEVPNKITITSIEPAWITFEVSSSGSEITEGMVIRVNDEVMLVTEAQGDQLSVIRGYQDTEVSFHPTGQEIEVANKVSLMEFFTKTEWNPQIGRFGIWALVSATLMTTIIAILVALPLGLSAAVYLSEYATEKTRSTIKPVLEVLAGIPTVVYGYFALTFMTVLLRTIFGNDRVEIYNTASAGIVIGILILPLVSSMSEDALSAVPRSLREAAFALGATKLETATRVVVPAAFSGLAAAIIVAISRAFGETMIVAIAAGAGPAFTLNPFKAAETMTGHIVRISGGDLSYDSIDYNSIFAIGLLLFIITLILNIISQRIVKRYREVYE